MKIFSKKMKVHVGYQNQKSTQTRLGLSRERPIINDSHILINHPEPKSDPHPVNIIEESFSSHDISCQTEVACIENIYKIQDANRLLEVDLLIKPLISNLNVVQRLLTQLDLKENHRYQKHALLAQES